MPDTKLEDLPEWLVADEILVRLPPKDVLRCRAVRKSWRAATSTDKFVLDHHRRQPSLPIIERHKEGIFRLAAAGTGCQKILRYTRDPVSNVAVIHEAACDGLLILSRQSSFFICNPATRKCAPLPRPPLRPGFSSATIAAFYRHRASGEHRVLWAVYSAPMSRGATVESPGYFVLPVGSDQPRSVQWPTVLEIFPATRSSDYPPVHHRGGLHWALGLAITVFDTNTETFRQMSLPAQLPGDMVSLLEMGGDLAFRRTAGDCVTMDVWVLQDYDDAETWAFPYRIDLQAMEASPPLNFRVRYVPRMVVINERELLVEQRPDRLLRCDTGGVFLGNVECQDHDQSLMNQFANSLSLTRHQGMISIEEERTLMNEFANSLSLTRHRLQESMISVPLFETQQEDAVNKEPPFIIVL